MITSSIGVTSPDRPTRSPRASLSSSRSTRVVTSADVPRPTVAGSAPAVALAASASRFTSPIVAPPSSGCTSQPAEALRRKRASKSARSTTTGP
jgi:hypothetical protein